MLQFLHQAIDGHSFADIDQLTDVLELLLSLLICGSARFFFSSGSMPPGSTRASICSRRSRASSAMIWRKRNLATFGGGYLQR